ncbi:MAG: bifunctional phosphoribosylaminoimidazolecarboxamide formyltransferase/IMP cyclohydrolase [Alphaproteobacteria bacterium]
MIPAKHAAPFTDAVTIKRALISVSDKTGIEEFARALASHGVHILSTGGTASLLSKAGINVTEVSDHTGFPEIMDGRVKTLHPKIHGGILARRDDTSHKAAMDQQSIEGIDMVVINLYPFVKTVQGGADFPTCIENIDIGGPAMIRAAAKNHDFVTVITDASDYIKVLDDMKAHKGAVSYGLRKQLAANAFSLTATYDSNIANWFQSQSESKDYPRHISFSGTLKQTLRYGENPHQGAALYTSESTRPGAALATFLQGKELSYNNLNDTNAAFELVAEFSEPAVAIIKHANPCGVATGKTMLEAYRRALACDPVSAFGGIIALNRPLDKETAATILEIFVEVIIAPSVEPAALELLKKKDKIRVLATGTMPKQENLPRIVTRIAGGFLVQDADSAHINKNDLKIVTKRRPTENEINDMLFAFTVAKHVKSNAIIYAKEGATVGIGAGQMSRIDSSRIAAWKMRETLPPLPPGEGQGEGLVCASDAFFPFADGLISAAEAGVTAVIQPGGSIRDAEVIAAADERGLAMVFTGIRHFRH